MTKYAYCCECRDDTKYRVVTEPRYYPYPYGDFNILYYRQSCLCTECNAEVFVPSYRDANNKAIQESIENARRFELCQP